MSEDKGKKTVLVVEDDPLSMRLTVDLLELNGFNTLKCADGKSAMEALQSIAPDLILLDIGLPGMDGYEVHKRIRDDSRFSRIKMIALSASVMKEDVEKIMAAGFDDFLPKPIDAKSFIKKIRERLSPA